MNSHIKNLFLLPALIVVLGLSLTGRVSAQTYTNLHAFTGGTDGSNPRAGLALSGNTLYGTMPNGGSGHGIVFKVNTDGTGFTNIYNFTASSDGGTPYAGLIVSGSTLYGTTGSGANGYGTVFAVSTNGLGFTLLHAFNSSTDGAYPAGALLQAGNLLFGTTYSGGSGNVGSIYVVNINTLTFTNLHNFAPVVNNTNADGGNSDSVLVLSGNTLYGSTEEYGPGGFGTVFALSLNTDQSGFTNLYAFTNGNDGAVPHGGVVLSGSTVYGTSEHTIFKIDTGGFKVMHTFNGGDNGSISYSRLILSGTTLYGTAEAGGSQNAGIVFALNADGTRFTNLYSFASGVAGAGPLAELVLIGTNVYGTTSHGDSINTGVVFRLSGVPLTLGVPQLAITRAGTNVILTWPTNATDFTLESTTNLAATAFWITNTPPPVVAGTNNAVTNGISGTQRFYRLSQ